MPSNFHIAKILNKDFAISQEDAEKLFPLVYQEIANSHFVELSFLGLENCSTLFLNNLIGKLYLTFGENLDNYLRISDIPNDDIVLNNQIHRLKSRILNKDTYQQIFDNAMN